jgi:predicted Rossmann fold nucleotide-binding protein DprA/Smf involved in DNA uptake
MTDDRRTKILTQLATVDTASLANILLDKDIKIVTVKSENYPDRLRTIQHVPYLLYIR